jgi:hypothetical protein
MSTSPQEPVARVVGAIIDIVDVDGERWSVSERDCRDVPGARGARCLVFMSEYGFRRVWEFPPNWRTLSVAELMKLSWRR